MKLAIASEVSVTLGMVLQHTDTYIIWIQIYSSTTCA